MSNTPSSPPPTPGAPYREYWQVPWHRKSDVNSALILLSIFTCGIIPGILLVCIFVLTGDIYYDKKDDRGNLKTWSPGNKIVAVILLLFNIASLYRRFH